MLLELQPEIIYGPIQSRRLGRSLGINILPSCLKLCSFNCLYCQYGWTDYDHMKHSTNVSLPSVSDVMEAVEKALNHLPEPPAYITFSGNGEPTLHPSFPDMVDGIIHIRDKASRLSKTAVLSNSSQVHIPAIRDALSRLDIKIMKLDAGWEKMFQWYNMPTDGVCLEEITHGLSLLQDVTIQTLFTTGSLGNTAEVNISKWIHRLKKISPVSVQLYSLDRDCPTSLLHPAGKKILHDIQRRLEKEKIRADVF